MPTSSWKGLGSSEGRCRRRSSRSSSAARCYLLFLLLPVSIISATATAPVQHSFRLSCCSSQCQCVLQLRLSVTVTSILLTSSDIDHASSRTVTSSLIATMFITLQGFGHYTGRSCDASRRNLSSRRAVALGVVSQEGQKARILEHSTSHEGRCSTERVEVRSVILSLPLSSF